MINNGFHGTAGKQWLTIPAHVWVHIFSYLSQYSELLTVGHVCYDWRLAQESAYLWEPVYLKLLQTWNYQRSDPKIQSLVESKRVIASKSCTSRNFFVSFNEEEQSLTQSLLAHSFDNNDHHHHDHQHYNNHDHYQQHHHHHQHYNNQHQQQYDQFYRHCVIRLLQLRQRELEEEARRALALRKQEQVLEYVEQRHGNVWRGLVVPVIIVSSTLFLAGILLKCLIPSLTQERLLWIPVFLMLYLFLIALSAGLLFSQVGSALASMTIQYRLQQHHHNGFYEDWFFFGICQTAIHGLMAMAVLLNMQLVFQWEYHQYMWNWWIIFSPVFVATGIIFVICMVWLLCSYEWRVECSDVPGIAIKLFVIFDLLVLTVSFFILLVCKLQYSAAQKMNWAIVFIPLYLYQLVFLMVNGCLLMMEFRSRYHWYRFMAVTLLVLSLVLVVMFETLLACGFGAWSVVCLLPVPTLLYTGFAIMHCKI